MTQSGAAGAPVGVSERRAPVHHQDLAERPDHDVFRFQVAVHETVCMRERHGIADPLEHA